MYKFASELLDDDHYQLFSTVFDNTINSDKSDQDKIVKLMSLLLNRKQHLLNIRV